MKDLNIIDAHEVAKVGDTASDMQEGTSAGCKYVIGITTGAFFSRGPGKTKSHTFN